MERSGIAVRCSALLARLTYPNIHHTFRDDTGQPPSDGFDKICCFAPFPTEFNFFQHNGAIIAADDIDFIAGYSCDLTRHTEVRLFKKSCPPYLQYLSLEKGEGARIRVGLGADEVKYVLSRFAPVNISISSAFLAVV